MSDNDFYFADSLNDGSICLEALIKLSSQSTICNFNKALNRILRDNKNNTIKVTNSTSTPDLNGLITALEPETVGRVVIGARTDISPSGGFTYDCKLFLPEGILYVIAGWTIYNKTRAEEVVSTLIKPLAWNQLLKYTFIAESENAPWHEQHLIPQDLEGAASSVFAFDNRAFLYSKEDIKRMIG